MNTTQHTEKTLKDFREKVKELDEIGKMSCEFGYKTTQEVDGVKETWTVPDWGNIESFLKNALAERDKVIVGELEGMKEIPEKGLVKRTDILKLLSEVDGWNKALSQAIEKIEG